MRIAACINLTPRKMGSGEQWILLFARRCREHGHELHFFWPGPVHPRIAQGLIEIGVGWSQMEALESAPFRWGRSLRKSFDLIYLNLVVPRSPAALAAYFAWPLPVLYFDQISGSLASLATRTLASRLLDPVTFLRITALAGCSDYVTNRDRLRFRLPADRCCTIYNGSDPEVFTPGARTNNGVPAILAAAYLIPEKGIDVLVEACGRIQDLPWRLIIVGDGPEIPRLVAIAKASGIANRLAFAGLQDHVHPFMRCADIFVHPAIWEEAFGLTISEAMSAGCATIASRVGGVPEIIEDGVSGCLVPPADPGALADALRALLNDPERRRRLGDAARQRVIDRFTLRASVEGQLDWIERRGKPV